MQVHQSISKLLASIRSDTLSFVAGATYSLAINLSMLLIGPKEKRVVWLILVLLLGSTVGFLAVGRILRAEEQEAASSADPSGTLLAGILGRIGSLLFWLLVALLPLVA